MMSRFAWRLVRPLQSFAYSSVISSTVAGKYHNVGDRVIYGWSSSEMAFMSLLALTGAHPPLQLVREKLCLPALPESIPSLSACLANGVIRQAELSPSSNLSGAMKREGLLGVWVKSEFMPSEHILVLNPDAPAFSGVTILNSCTLSRSEFF